MANAAAKKAAAAKNQATRIYLPLLVVTNLIYVALLGNIFGTSTTAGVLSSNWGIAGTIVTWIEQAYSYVGILDHHAANASAGNSKSNSKGKQHNKHNKNDLAGGSSLDLLAVTLVVQFGSVLHSKAWLWLTVVGVPVVAAYQLYRAVGGSSNSTNKSDSNNSNSNNSSDNADGTDDDPMAAKRRRRAEKRRQKWG